MKRVLALAAAGVTLTLVLAGCGHGLRQAARDGSGPVAPAATTVVHQPPAGATSTAAVDADLSAVGNSLSDIDNQLSRATAAADSDN
jgi:hypothetical protein